MYFDPASKENKPIVDYFKSKKCLVVDPSGIIRTTFKKLMVGLGMNSSNIYLTESFFDAQENILKERPNFIFTNYKVHDPNKAEHALGIDLLKYHIDVQPNRLDAGFFLTTDENSMSVASIALDHEVDGLFARPFTIETLQTAVLQSIETKVNPPKYSKEIEDGKAKFFTKNFRDAMEIFTKAKSLNEKPTLACYYLGMIERAEARTESAETHFTEGLKFDPFHYKSLRIMAEICFQDKRHEEAYQYHTRIVEKYPVSPDRIPELTRLSIINKKYQDIINYCEIFSSIFDGGGNDMLRTYISAGLAICGKFLLNFKSDKNGVKILEQAAKLSGGKKEIMESTISSLIEANLEQEAERFLTTYSTDKTGAVDFDVFKVMIFNKDPSKDNDVLALGRKLISKKVKSLEVYRIVLKKAKQLGVKKETIQEMADEAIKFFPKEKKEFMKYIK